MLQTKPRLVALHRKSVVATALLTLTSLFSVSLQATPILLAHWNFDEGIGALASDQTGLHHATLIGPPIWDLGRIGPNSLLFDGFDDFLAIANPNPLRIASGDYSFFCWIKTTNPDLGTIIADRNTGPSGEGFFFRVGRFSGDGELFLHLGSGLERKQYLTVSADLHDSEWHHVGFTWENATDTLRIYVDGAQYTNILKAVDHPLDGDSVASMNNLEIGRRPNGAQYFQGGIDDARIYRSSLSAAEILALYNGGPTITILEPDGDDTADQDFTIAWADDDPDHDASIALYYDDDDSGADGILIVGNLSEDDETDQYLWDVSALPPGDYYVYGEIDNGVDLVMTSYSCGTVTVLSTPPPPPPALTLGIRDSTRDLVIKNNQMNPASTLETSAAEAILQNQSGDAIRVAPVAFTVDINSSGAGGLDEGIRLPSHWYHVWVIHNTDSNISTGLLSLDPEHPTLPSGFDYKARLGAIFTDSGSGDFILIHQIDHRVVRKSQQAISESSTVFGKPFSIESLVPPTARQVSGTVDSAEYATASYGYLATTSEGLGARSFGFVFSLDGNEGNLNTFESFELPLVVPQTMYLTLFNGKVFVNVSAWEF